MSEPYRPLFSEVPIPEKEAAPKKQSPTAKRLSIASFVKEVCRERGVRLLGDAAHEVLHSEGLDGWRIRLGMPQMYVAVEFEDIDHSNGEEMLKAIDIGIKQLFQSHVDHIANHWRDPLDRLTKIEAAAQALVDRYIDLETTGTSKSIPALVFELFELLRSKPGAVSWHKNGFGEDPKVKP